MCFGLPWEVMEGDDMVALCRRGALTRRVGMMLVGAQPAGALVLVHLDNAVRVLDAQEAARIDSAMEGLAAALRGEDFETHFADLIGREPELPPNPG